MRLEFVEKTLRQLAELIEQHRFEELETDTLEFKSIPAVGAEWNNFHQTVCAFLNTRGGVIILGVKEEGTGQSRRYIHTGWQTNAEPKIRQLSHQFTDERGHELSISESFPSPQLFDFLRGRVAAVLVDELPAHVKFAFYQRQAYRRVLTGDIKISEAEIERQREFKEASLQARELDPISKFEIRDFDLDKLNDYIAALNKGAKIETVKADLDSAMSFLVRRDFIKDGKATTLGVLVCGSHPEDHLGFRCHVHGYVDVPHEIARDKQDFVNNILPLMESSYAYLLRNIQVGVSIERGGTSRPQYPEELLRETVNNALAHRDYSINRQVVLVIKPGHHIAIQNPGTFRPRLLVEDANDPIPLRRILPEAKPRNPRLADVLRVFRKWEGRGIGMATMVNLCLQNEIDLPYYVFKSEEVTLHVCAGQLVDERMKRLFKSFDRFIGERLQGRELSPSQESVLSYLVKSEWANELARYTILLTPDNNHFRELVELERFQLITRHHKSSVSQPIYVADRVLMRKDYVPELRLKYGLLFDALPSLSKEVLSVVYRFNNFSRAGDVAAKTVSFDLWEASGGADDIRAFDSFYRKVRIVFNNLAKDGFLEKVTRYGYVLCNRAGEGVLGSETPNGSS